MSWRGLTLPSTAAVAAEASQVGASPASCLVRREWRDGTSRSALAVLVVILSQWLLFHRGRLCLFISDLILVLFVVPVSQVATELEVAVPSSETNIQTWLTFTNQFEGKLVISKIMYLL